MKEKLSRAVTLEEVREANYNFSPLQFVKRNDKATHRGIPKILADLTKAERERADDVQEKILADRGMEVLQNDK